MQSSNQILVTTGA